MTAQKRTVITCDGPRGRAGGCPARFLGGLQEPLGQVRVRAKNEGWASWSTSADMFRVTVDYCPKHQ